MLLSKFNKNNLPHKIIHKINFRNGDFWYQTRTIANPVLMQPKTVRLYVTKIEEIADEFIAKMKAKLDNKNELPDNFLYELNRWSLESIGYIALDRRLNVISDEKQDERSKKMIKVNLIFF